MTSVTVSPSSRTPLIRESNSPSTCPCSEHRPFWRTRVQSSSGQLDQPGAGLDVHEGSLDGVGVVADLDLLVDLGDLGGPVELHRVAPLVLVGDDVGELVRLSLSQLGEVRGLEGDELDRARLVA